MSERARPAMAPDSHPDSAVQQIADMTLTPGTAATTTPLYHPHPHPHPNHPDAGEKRVITTRPLPNGILFKGKKVKKHVSFRDSQLVNIREIPPRSSSCDEESEEDEDGDGSSDSDEDSESSDSGEEEQPSTPQPAPVSAVVNNSDKSLTTVSVSREMSMSKTSPSPPTSTLTVRPERAPIPWTPVSSFTGAKGPQPQNAAASPAAKVVSFVSRITGVTPPATHTHIHTKYRSAAVTAPSPSPSPSPSATRKPPSPVPPKKAPTVVRVEKKVKKITPTLDNVMTSQTVRSVQKHGAVTEALHKGSAVKTGKKKRVLQRRQEGGGDKRKATPSRKSRDSKQSSNNSKSQENSVSRPHTASGKRVSSAGARPRSVMNGFSHVRDSLSLPPLSSDDSVLPSPAKLLQHRTLAKPTVYSVDGFIFPGDPTHDLAAGLKASATAARAEDVKLKPEGPPATTSISGYPGRDPVPGQTVRDRVSSAPPGSPSRRKRFYAWQMANGNLQNSLYEPPSITPMWESMTPAQTPTPKPAYVTDR